MHPGYLQLHRQGLLAARALEAVDRLSACAHAPAGSTGRQGAQGLPLLLERLAGGGE